jgi:hypothetical protein
MMTNDNNAIVSPVGAVWKYIRVQHPTIELYSPDESHPSVHGTYAAACSFYATLLRKNPSNITFVPAGITPADAQLIRNAATRVVMDSFSTWKIDAYDPNANYNYSVPAANTYLFNNTSTNATTYTWYFGDGTTSNVSNPTTVLTPQNANATLVASNCFATDSMTLSLTPFHLDEMGTIDSKTHVVFYNLVGQKLATFNEWNDHCNQFIADHRNEILIVTHGGRTRKISFQ